VAVTGGMLVLVALVLAKVHACACTGGQPEWRVIDSAADNNGR